ncbi:F-actin-capping protein subunit alpha [Cichlidogyrus casuarinus]|uniref:F-actin-capping protein subunit alpha n=1 Tax=Cichlidogyrus casuarinus TaxID=1844966 RepID=A0ABD2QAS8_9PLAT
MKKELETFLDLSRTVGREVKNQSLVVKEAFDEAYEVLRLASQYAQPKKEDLDKILFPLNKKFTKIQEFVPADRNKMYFHELTTVSDSILMLAWFNIFDPITFTEEMLVGAQTYSNKVVQSCLDRRQKHVEWVRAWLAVLQALCNMVKRYYGGGLRWKSGKGNPYPPLPTVADEAAASGSSIKESEKKKAKKFIFKPKLSAGFNRDDLLSEIANAKKKLNLKHVPVSNRLT